MAAMTLLRPPAYLSSRTLSTRFLHSVLRGITRDRLDLLGEEYFQYVLKPAMRQEAVQKLVDAVRSGERVVLVGQLLEHILRPMAEYFSVQGFIANRLEFREGVATGRLREPVIRPRGPFAWLASGSADGRLRKNKLLSQLDWKKTPELLGTTVQPRGASAATSGRPVELFSDTPRVDRLNVRETLAGKHIMLIGVTGFIGKVWLVDLLEKIPNIRKSRCSSGATAPRPRNAASRKLWRSRLPSTPCTSARSPPGGLPARQSGSGGRRCQPAGPGPGRGNAGAAAAIGGRDRKQRGSHGFQSDLRDALSSNVDPVNHILEFLRHCEHAGLIHLSTCYVVGMRDGRVGEELRENYNPANHPDFDASGKLPRCGKW